MIFKGEITGSGSLVIDGSVEGTINLHESHVTLGYNSQVTADIAAREIVVMGKIRGTVTALNLLDIRAEGSVTGKAVAARLTIEEGACFGGSIDTLGHAVGLESETVLANDIPEHSKTFLVGKPVSGKSILRPLRVSA
jgi:cytoskeletal protein CcmA (bactofilin family)